jgi:hypothetical protein
MKLKSNLFFILIFFIISSCSKPDLKVGDKHGGGIVGYIYGRGDKGFDEKVQHGIIVSIKDLDSVSTWDKAKSQAKEFNSEGFDDWQLPTKEEVILLYRNKNLIGGFKDKETEAVHMAPFDEKNPYAMDENDYWISDTAKVGDGIFATMKPLKFNFLNGKLNYQYYNWGKDFTCNVRVVRYF